MKVLHTVTNSTVLVIPFLSLEWPITLNSGHRSPTLTVVPSEHKQAKLPPAFNTHNSLHEWLAHGFGTEILDTVYNYNHMPDMDL
jgi:hypothetical protein